MKICIEQTPEGISVYDEMNPEGAMMVSSVDEALEAARSMLGGGMADEPPLMDGEEEFVEGFKGPSGY